MSDRRPPDDPWGPVLDRVEDALDDAGVGPDAERDSLLDGVRAALDALVGLEPTDGGRPEVVVVDGGRAQDAPPTESERPTLRVAAPAAPPAAGDVDAPPVGVRWAAGDVTLDLDRLGRILLDAEQPEQTLFRGVRPRAYRVGCTRGVMRVSADGAPLERVTAGRSIDVEARVLQVTLAGEAVAAGRYVRLSGDDA
jgi:hypothetical protein